MNIIRQNIKKGKFNLPSSALPRTVQQRDFGSWNLTSSKISDLESVPYTPEHLILVTKIFLATSA